MAVLLTTAHAACAFESAAYLRRKSVQLIRSCGDSNACATDTCVWSSDSVH
jgi:hypothetical protein